MMPTRIQRRRATGYRQPPSTRFCGRPSGFGNPFPVAEFGQLDAVAMHAAWLAGTGADLMWSGRRMYDRDWVLANLPTLREYRHVSCFCGLDQACHVDTLLAMLDT